MSRINLSSLETLSGYRSDTLYFIRLCGTYIQSIFWDSLSGTSKTAVNRKRAVREFAKHEINNKELLVAIIDDKVRWHQTLDCFKGDFVKFLKILDHQDKSKLPNNLISYKNVIEDRLRLRHGIFLSLTDFISIIETLLKARHYLEHFTDRKPKNKIKKFTDKSFIEAIAMLMPPHFAHLYMGHIKSWQTKLANIENSVAKEELKQDIRNIFDSTSSSRKKDTYNLFSQERKRTKLTDKNKRKALVTENQKWYRFYKTTSCKFKNDYRQHTFMMRYHFVGEQNINCIINKRFKTFVNPYL